MRRENAAHLALRLGAALAFLYPPLAALADPVSWEGYFPHFVRALPVDTLYLLHGFGALEAVLALWVLSGWKIRIPAALMTLILAAIVILDFNDIGILFRDISIACLTLALAAWPAPSSGAQDARVP
ncbi:MAG TPA: hypothetical protein VHC68_01350 [Candidatus Paceibacterota bacterium]|nr:hypothetical protein [Candidatus Paceibacterota bacterium]